MLDNLKTFVILRPYLKEFLEECSTIYNIILYTAAETKYAN